MNTRPALLWGRKVRILHWLLALVVLANLFIFEEGDDTHRWIGYFALFCVVVRFWIGATSTDHSGFRRFPLRVQDFTRFFRQLFSSKAVSFEGHNPVASLNYFVIWFCVLALALTGWMMGLDRYFGEEWLEDLHSRISLVLEAMIVMHLIGMIYDSFKYRRHSWLSMIRGRR